MKKDIKIKVFSYLNCVQAVVRNTDTKIAIISIQDADGFGFEFKPVRNCKAVVTIYADDADTVKGTIATQYVSNIEASDINKENAEVSEDVFEGYKLFSENDAKRIADMVKSIDDIDELWIHCYAGISRSSGVAAAISKYLTNDDSYYFNHYIPNMRIFRMTLEALFDN